jgi:hypothetical protein
VCLCKHWLKPSNSLSLVSRSCLCVYAELHDKLQVHQNLPAHAYSCQQSIQAHGAPHGAHMLVAVAIRWWDGLVSAQLVCCLVLMGTAVCNTLALWRHCGSMCASQTWCALLTNFC